VHATEPGAQQSAVTDLEMSHSDPDPLDGPRDVASGDVRKGEPDAWKPTPLPDVQVIEGAGLDPNKNLAGPREGIRSILETQFLRSPMFVKPDSLHGVCPWYKLRSSGPAWARCETY